MKAIKMCLLLIAAIAFVVALSGCGGGGGGSTGGNLPAVTYSIMGIVSGAPQGTSVDLSGAKIASTTTNSIGYYQFIGLSNGSYTVTPYMPGYTLSPASLPVTISSVNATNKNFSVVFGIIGSVKTPGSIGVPGATITLVNSSGAATTRTTDANGNYSALGLAAGKYTVSAALVSYSMNPLNQTVTVTCDVDTGVDFTGTIGTTYSIMGTAWTDTTFTAAQPNVLMNLSGDNSGFVYTSASGTYAFQGLLPGSYTVTASSFRTDYQSITPPGLIINTNLVWDFAGSKRIPTPIVPIACLDLSGTITGPANNGTTVNILYRTYTSSTTVTSDISGNYLKSVPSGSYVITPSMMGRTFNPPRICGADFSCVSGTTVTAIGNFTSQ